jgi:hypothetical protein
MVLVGAAYPPDPVHGPFVADMATERVAGVRRVRDKAAAPNRLDDLCDAPRLRVVGVYFD